MRITLCAAVIVLATSFAAAEDKAAVREIPPRGLVNYNSGVGNSKINKPVVITSAADLAKNKAFLKTAADAITKQVDFEKEKLVFFFWGSSSLQEIVPDADKPGMFTYTTRFSKSGRFTSRAKLFVVPKDAEVKVTQKK